MSTERDREALLQRRRELYQQQRERETPEEREIRLASRREYYRRCSAALRADQHESFRQREEQLTALMLKKFQMK